LPTMRASLTSGHTVIWRSAPAVRTSPIAVEPHVAGRLTPHDQVVPIQRDSPAAVRLPRQHQPYLALR
jgi:hypothetical protein